MARPLRAGLGHALDLCDGDPVMHISAAGRDTTDRSWTLAYLAGLAYLTLCVVYVAVA